MKYYIYCSLDIYKPELDGSKFLFIRKLPEYNMKIIRVAMEPAMLTALREMNVYLRVSVN